MSYTETSLNETKKKLDSISSSMCLAKWKQVTLHLGLGHTHSCHHPRTHKIPEKLLKQNPSVLHNTPYKKDQRRMMLEGVRPSECQYCWSCEDLNEDVYSDRIIKSNDFWAKDSFDEIINDPMKDINPSYVEVSFSNACNFKCSYCSPQFSSKWMEEINQFGGYDTTFQFNDEKWLDYHDRRPIPNNKPNPYIDAFWEWWPELYKNLKVFRITGGEPLLSKDTLKVLEYISNIENKNLCFSINTNACVPHSLWLNFLNQIKIIENKRNIKNFELYASIDTWGTQAEYIRHGLNFNKFEENILNYLINTNYDLTFMVTFNILSVFSFKKLLEWVSKLKEVYGQRIKIDTSYLRNPVHQNVQMSGDFFDEFYDDIENYIFINDNFMDWEKDKIYRIRLYKDSDKKDILEKDAWKDFIVFFNEHDKRRETSLLDTFPEIQKFYDFCLEQYNEFR